MMQLSQQKQINKNGVIEFMRFLFASGIVFFHTSRDFWNNQKIIGQIGQFQVTFFRKGNIGVEFFFLVSGCLLASHIYKLNSPVLSVGEETVGFLWKKVRQIMPYYLPACFMMACIKVARGGVKRAGLFEKLPSLLFLQRTGGFPESFIPVVWYISSMLIAMAVIYPICRRYYKTYTVLIAPLACCLLLGALIHNTGGLGGSGTWMFVTYKTNIRAFAEIGMGTTCYEVSRRMRERSWNPIGQKGLSVAAVVCYMIILCYVISNVDSKFSIHMFYLMCIAVTITFSETGWIARTHFFQKQIFMYLGSLSLPLYLFQNVPRRSLPHFFRGMAPQYLCVLIYLGTLVLAMAANRTVTLIRFRKGNHG